MNFKEFEKMVGNRPAKIEAEVNKKGVGTLSLEGRGLELMALSMQIAEDVMKKTHTDVEKYCVMLKEGIRGKNDDSKADEESKEESKAITKEQLKKAYQQVLDDVFDDKDLDFKEKFAFSLLLTKCVNDMCKFLFDEGLRDESSRDRKDD